MEDVGRDNRAVQRGQKAADLFLGDLLHQDDFVPEVAAGAAVCLRNGDAQQARFARLRATSRARRSPLRAIVGRGRAARARRETSRPNSLQMTMSSSSRKSARSTFKTDIAFPPCQQCADRGRRSDRLRLIRLVLRLGFAPRSRLPGLRPPQALPSAAARIRPRWFQPGGRPRGLYQSAIPFSAPATAKAANLALHGLMTHPRRRVRSASERRGRSGAWRGEPRARASSPSSRSSRRAKHMPKSVVMTAGIGADHLAQFVRPSPPSRSMRPKLSSYCSSPRR